MNMVQLHDDVQDLNVDIGKLDFSQTDAQIEAAESAAASVLSKTQADTIEGDETVVWIKKGKTNTYIFKEWC